jgi:hypothetical protein
MKDGKWKINRQPHGNWQIQQNSSRYVKEKNKEDAGCHAWHIILTVEAKGWPSVCVVQTCLV